MARTLKKVLSGQAKYGEVVTRVRNSSIVHLKVLMKYLSISFASLLTGLTHSIKKMKPCIVIKKYQTDNTTVYTSMDTF